jgi:2-methylcitrate dehydratase PrpD
MLSYRVASCSRHLEKQLTEMSHASNNISRFLVRSSWEDVPQSVRHEATRTLVHWVGCAVGGCAHDTVERAVRAQIAMACGGSARVFGRGELLSAPAAACVNGISSHVLDFDDTQLGPTNVHPTGPVASALFALAELKHLTGADFLHALILGIEIECRLANVVFSSANRGWHVTGAVGTLGAAAACAKALRLDEQQTMYALGIGTTQIIGLREMFGTMCKSLHTGRAADNGLISAMLAAEGYTAPSTAIDGIAGYAQVVNGPLNLSGLVKDLGNSFEISKLSYKPYACGIVMHPSIEACLEMRRERPRVAEELVAVELRVHPDVMTATGKRDPESGLETKFSIYHAVAAALRHGIAGEAAFSDSMAVDPEVVALRDRVVAIPDAGIRKDEVHAIFKLTEGSAERHVAHAIGSVHRPMSDADIGCKFETLACERLGKKGSSELLSRCWAVSRLDDVRSILAAAVI